MTTTTDTTEGTADLPPLAFFIDGEFRSSPEGAWLDSINPYTGTAWARVPMASQVDVDQAVTAARRALRGPWGTWTGAQRADMLRSIALKIAENVEELATVESRDNGKLMRETRQVAGNLPRWFNYFAGSAERLGGATHPVASPNYFVYTTREPIGVVAAVIPWNAPLMLFAMKVAPALAAGCTLVVKTAEQTTASALTLARLMSEAGLPPGVLNIITGEGKAAGRALVRHPGVDKVSFTGSTESGKQVMGDAASHLAPVTLELGGKSANLVFADADLEAAANGVVASVFAAAGQMCIAGGRLLVERSVHDELVERVAARARTIQLGDPHDPKSEMGPLATEQQRDRVLALIGGALDNGAELIVGGGQPEGHGFFLEPTILTGLRSDSTIVTEEVFGPVLVVLPFDDEDEGVAMANDTRYGLAGGVWTRDLQRAHRVARRVRAGTVWLNCYRATDPAVPFGGMKDSGIGRENGDEAVLAFTENKSVWVETSGETRDPFVMG